MLTELFPAGFAPVAVEEVKAFLRVDASSEDAVIGGFVRASAALSEAFTGQWLIARDFTQTVAASGDWQRLAVAPVVAIDGLADAAGALPGGAYEVDIDLAGAGWVRLLRGDATARVTVTGRAGLAASWNGVPEPLRAGIVRMAAHLFTHRDDPDATALPAGVSALWRPWRRISI
ncbi:head-tail connector protein [Glacieibacterium sp.]|uniref:head-tail connector protein n=1 Tax=Glacieibacterium sp. TaxID=2860237 RepID=UPI003AFF6487